MSKTAEAFRTIGEVAEELDVPKHVLRFWEGKFPHIRPMKRGGGRRYYRPEDMELLRGIRRLLHAEGYTIKGVQKILREQGIDQVKAAARASVEAAESSADRASGAKRRGRKSAAAVPPAAATQASMSTVLGTKTTPVTVKKAAAMPTQLSQKDVIAAAIRELQACRDRLAGKVAALEVKATRVARS